MSFLFKKKDKKNTKKTVQQIYIDELESQVYYNKKSDYNDFISILEQIQNTNNSNLQWKKKQKTIENATRLAIENYKDKIIELDIKA